MLLAPRFWLLQLVFMCANREGALQKEAVVVVATRQIRELILKADARELALEEGYVGAICLLGVVARVFVFVDQLDPVVARTETPSLRCTEIQQRIEANRRVVRR